MNGQALRRPRFWLSGADGCRYGLESCRNSWFSRFSIHSAPSSRMILGRLTVGGYHGVVLTASRSVASHNARSSPAAGVCFVRVLLRNRAWTQHVGSLSGRTPDSNALARSPVHGCSLGISGRLSPFYCSPSDARIASARTGSPVRAAGNPLVEETTAAVPFPWPAAPQWAALLQH